MPSDLYILTLLSVYLLSSQLITEQCQFSYIIREEDLCSRILMTSVSVLRGLFQPREVLSGTVIET